MSTTAFTNAHVFDGRAFLDGRNDVVVSDGVVVATGPGAAAGYADADVVDLAGRTLLPGGRSGGPEWLRKLKDWYSGQF